MTAEDPELELRYERFRLVYTSATVLPSFYCSDVTLREVQVSHPMATVEPVEGSRVAPPGSA